MRVSKEETDCDFALGRTAERCLRRALVSRTAESGANSRIRRRRSRTTRRTHLQNGDFLLFRDDDGLDDPLDASFKEQEGMQISDDSYGQSNIRSSRPRGRPRRRPRDVEDAGYHLEDEELENLSESNDDSRSPAMDYCNQ